MKCTCKECSDNKFSIIELAKEFFSKFKSPKPNITTSRIINMPKNIMPMINRIYPEIVPQDYKFHKQKIYPDFTCKICKNKTLFRHHARNELGHFTGKCVFCKYWH